MKKELIRTGDLAPKGVKSTYQKEKTGFNETFNHIFNQIRNVQN